LIEEARNDDGRRTARYIFGEGKKRERVNLVEERKREREREKEVLWYVLETGQYVIYDCVLESPPYCYKGYLNACTAILCRDHQV
jgi:hypothetical protein